MAQLLMHGTNYVNFIGRYCWVAAGDRGLSAVAVTERDEPQAVIGSTLHELAFPDFYRKHLENERILRQAHHHPGKDIADSLLHPLRKTEVLGLQLRGEYLFAACGEGGLRVFDVAFIDDKGFSERITTAPVSPLGQRFFVPTTYATAVASPATLTPDPTRTHRPENREPTIHPLYGYVYVTDRYEGLIVVGVATTINGNPLDNFLHRELTFNPNGILNGATSITIVGTYAYICCDAGLVVVSLDNPKCPQVTTVLGSDVVFLPRAVQAQFRYAFVCDAQGIKVLDITDLARPRPVARLDLAEANAIYLAHTYAYVAAGPRGLVILDIENPERPRVDQVYQRRWLHQRSPRRQTRHHVRQRIRLPGRWPQRPAHRAVDVARNAGELRFQPAADAEPDRHLPVARARKRFGHFQRTRSRPRRRRERESDLCLRAHRCAALEPGRAAPAVPAQRHALESRRRSARSDLRRSCSSMKPLVPRR